MFNEAWERDCRFLFPYFQIKLSKLDLFRGLWTGLASFSRWVQINRKETISQRICLTQNCGITSNYVQSMVVMCVI